jgi:primosomal protein N' (replication factor Y)
MRYAKVVVGLPVEGPFDYIVPEGFQKKVSAGCRVVISFGHKLKIGYVVELTSKTAVKNLKTLSQVLDETPVLNKKMLLLTKKVSEYYCCSWGEAIETALPDALRKGKIITLKNRFPEAPEGTHTAEPLLIHCLDTQELWNNVYILRIKDTLNANRSALVLLSDISAIAKAEKILKMHFDCPIAVLYRKQPDELNTWTAVKEGNVKIVIGTRSSIFAPLDTLGLIIVDDEQAYAYKQDQVPHYQARQVALLRAEIDNATLILGSSTPSLEAVYLAKKKKLKYTFIPNTRACPEIRIIDMKGLPLLSFKKNVILSKYLEDSIAQVLQIKGKVLLFLNRFGFATTLLCSKCGMILKCRRCNTHLVFHYKENILSCHYCNFKMEPPRICPDCNSGYIRYTGAGTEKMVSELSRVFPQARVTQVDVHTIVNTDAADIFIATQSIIKEKELNFALVGVLSIDNSLQHIDFRAAEKAFNVLMGLAALTDKKMVVQTNLPGHYLFEALSDKNPELFYKEELRQRKELKFPPYRHMALIKLRGSREDKVVSASALLFEKLSSHSGGSIEVMSVNPGNPQKLRGNFYRQILLRSGSPLKICKFLKIHLNSFSHSGIIVTVDMDPV